MEAGALVLSVLLAAAPDPSPPAARTVRVRGVELAYVEEGRGQPIVLLHGFGHDYRVWSVVFETLSKSYRVIAYSRRHNFPNPQRGEAPTKQTPWRSDLAAFIAALNLGHVHLIGHSAGANLALLLAREHPRLVRSLILAEPFLESIVAGNSEAQKLPSFPFEEPFGCSRPATSSGPPASWPTPSSAGRALTIRSRRSSVGFSWTTCRGR